MRSQLPTAPKLLTIRQAADVLAVKPATVRRWAKAQRLPGMKVGPRGDWRFERAAIDSFKSPSREKYQLIKRFVNEQAERICARAETLQRQHWYTTPAHHRCALAEAHVNLVRDFAARMDKRASSNAYFERVAAGLAKGALERGCTLEEAVDGIAYLKRAFLLVLKEEGLLFELTTHDLFSFTETVSSFADMVTASIAHLYQSQAVEHAMFGSAQLEAIINSMVSGVAVLNPRGRLLLANKAQARLMGFATVEELLEKLTYFSDVFHFRTLDGRSLKVRNWPMARALRGETVESAELRGERRDIKQECSFSFSAKPVFDQAGRIVAAVIITRDITERVRQQRALVESEASLRQVMDSMLSFVAVLEPDGTLRDANESALARGGVVREEVVGKKLWECYWWSYDPAVSRSVQRMVRAAARGEVVRRDMVARTVGNGRVTVDFMIAPARDSRGRVTRLIPSAVDITERQAAEESLRASEVMFRGTFDNAAVGIAHVALDGSWLRVNDRLLAITGYTREELLHRTFQSITHPDDLARDLEYAAKLQSGELDSYTVEKRYLCKSGGVVWVQLTGSLVHRPDGVADYFISVVEDISHRKRTEANQQAILSLHQRALSGHPVVDICQTATEMLVDRLELELASVLKLEARQHLRFCAGTGWGGEVQMGETVIVARDAAHRTLLRTGRPAAYGADGDRNRRGAALQRQHGAKSGVNVAIRGSAGVWGVLGVHTTIHRVFTQAEVDFLQAVANVLALAIQLEGATDELRSQHAVLEAVMHNASSALFMMDEEQRCTYMNTAAEKMIGYRFDELRERDASLHELIHHSYPNGSPYPIEACPISRVLPERNRSRGEDVFIRRDGTYFPVEYVASSIVVRGRSVGVVLEVRDLTEEKAAEAELRRNQAWFQSLSDANIIGVMRISLDGAILNANDAFLNIVGYTRAELRRGLRWDELTLERFRDADAQGVSELLKTGVAAPWEKAYRHKDGHDVPVILGAVLTDARRREAIAFVLDITERKQVEARKDEFISIASHELKTPLTSAMAYGQLLARAAHTGDLQEIRGYVRRTNHYIDRLSGLITDLLDITKLQAGRLALELNKYDFNTLIHEVVESMRPLSETHKIYCSGRVRGQVCGDRSRMEQVLTNLLSNAIKYSPGAARIDVTVTQVHGEVVVAVRDYGIGIPVEKQHQLFTRFYRVEDSAQHFSGLGIGLYIASEIVSRHGGTMWLESAVHRGSTFYFKIPMRAHYASQRTK